MCVCYLLSDKIPFSAEDGRAFAVADYGCRDGGISVPLIRHLIGAVFMGAIRPADVVLFSQCEVQELEILHRTRSTTSMHETPS